jgi:hypothetical protein
VPLRGTFFGGRDAAESDVLVVARQHEATNSGFFFAFRMIRQLFSVSLWLYGSSFINFTSDVNQMLVKNDVRLYCENDIGPGLKIG